MSHTNVDRVVQSCKSTTKNNQNMLPRYVPRSTAIRVWVFSFVVRLRFLLFHRRFESVIFPVPAVAFLSPALSAATVQGYHSLTGSVIANDTIKSCRQNILDSGFGHGHWETLRFLHIIQIRDTCLIKAP